MIDAWDDFIRQWNSGAPLTANRAFHTSETWVEAETNASLVTGAIETVLVVLLTAFLSVFFSTFSFSLSVFSICLVLFAIITLFFFMVSIMGWSVGPIELLSLIVFVGYSVTYPLHVAH